MCLTSELKYLDRHLSTTDLLSTVSAALPCNNLSNHIVSQSSAVQAIKFQNSQNVQKVANKYIRSLTDVFSTLATPLQPTVHTDTINFHLVGCHVYRHSVNFRNVNVNNESKSFLVVGGWEATLAASRRSQKCDMTCLE